LDLKDKKVNEHLRKVNEKTGHMATIHTEGETKIDKILRVTLKLLLRLRFKLCRSPLCSRPGF